MQGSRRAAILGLTALLIAWPLHGAVAVGTADGAVPVGTTSTASQLGVMGGGVAIGSAYAPATAAPTDGLIVSGRIGVGTATPQSLVHAYGGEAQVGSAGGSCSTNNAGAIRYTSGNGLQYCNGSSWTTVNTISNTAGSVGYFVLSKGTYTGSLGGLSGADSTCLTELTTNTSWMGYSTALAAGQLVSGNVHAFLCDANFCNVMYPNTTYYFANANNATYGGASFTTNAQGYGPGDSNAWSGSTFFSYGSYYWTGHTGPIATYWGDYNNSDSCTSWTSTSGTGESGMGAQTNGGRISYTNNNCSSSYPLICVVQPQQQVVTQGADVGWFVTTSTNYTGNLGGLSGANASCLSNLTGTTNWKGYTAANANGQLTSSKVFAFLCDGTNCNNLQANTTYYFAGNNDVTAGGSSFTTDGSGLGPNDASAWSIANHFGVGVNAWTGRGTTSNTAWANSSSTNNCSAWTSSSAGTNGDPGTTSATTSSRWNNGSPASCGTGERLICFINP